MTSGRFSVTVATPRLIEAPQNRIGRHGRFLRSMFAIIGLDYTPGPLLNYVWHAAICHFALVPAMRLSEPQALRGWL